MAKRKPRQTAQERHWLPLRLKPYRDAKKLSQAALGDALGFSDVSIGRIEAGKQNWTCEFLQDAAKVLGVHWSELLPPASHDAVGAIWDEIPPQERPKALAVMRALARPSDS